MSPSRPPHALLLHHLRLVLCALLWLFASTASSAAPAPVDALPDQASAITPAAGEALGHRPWAMVLCKFADVPAEPAPLSYHQQLFAGPAPSIADYWREASYGQLDLTGSVVRGWYTLPRPRAAYLTEPPPLTANLALLKSDCLAAADADLFYPSFAGVAMVFNAETDGAARGGCGQRTTLDGVEQVYGFTYLPSAQPLSVGLTIHEMSHAFCLGHSGSSYDTVENGGGPIGSTASLTALTPSFSKHVHPNAYHKQVLGWLPDARVVTVPWGTERAVDIERLANPGPQGALLVRVEHATAAHQYLTLETRLSAGYEAFQDTNPYLDRAGVVMHAIDTTRANGYARSGTAMAVDTGRIDGEDLLSVCVTSRTATSMRAYVGTGVPGRCDFDTGPLGQAFAVARGGDVLTYTLRLHALPDRATAGVTGTLTFGDLWYKDELISATSSQGQITPGAPGTWTFALDLGTLEAGQDAVVTVAVRPVDWEGRRGSAVGTTVMIALAGAGATRSYQLDVRAPDSVLPAALPTPRQYLPLLRRS